MAAVQRRQNPNQDVACRFVLFDSYVLETTEEKKSFRNSNSRKIKINAHMYSMHTESHRARPPPAALLFVH